MGPEFLGEHGMVQHIQIRMSLSRIHFALKAYIGNALIVCLCFAISSCGETAPSSSEGQTATQTSTSTQGAEKTQSDTISPNKNGTSQTTNTQDSPIICVPTTLAVPKPTTIAELVNVLNSLPMPLQLPCFIKSLPSPLGMNATTSTISVQPASGYLNPRFFIMLNPLVLGVVPEGTGKYLLELSELISDTESIKGEIKFPIENKIEINSLFTRLGRHDGAPGTSCAGCHLGERESQFQGQNVFISRAFRPSAKSQVNFETLKSLVSACGLSTTSYRCEMIRALLGSEVETKQTPRAIEKGFSNETPTMF